MDKVIEKFRHINSDFREEVIDFYHKNQLHFDNVEGISEIETIEEVVLIKQKYAEALESKVHYKELDIILKQIFILLAKIKDKSQKYDSYYERALLYEGILLARQQKYAQSNRRFKELITNYPTNAAYTNWYRSNKKKLIEKNVSFCENTAIIAIVFIVLLGRYIFGRFNFIIMAFAFLFYIGTCAYSYLSKKRSTTKK